MNPYHIVNSTKPFAQTVADLETAVTAHHFSVLHTHDLGAKLRAKGVEFAEECHILEVCNPGQAAKVLAADMRLNTALPCRISVYTEQGQTKIGMIKPGDMLSALSSDPALRQVAGEVEAQTIQMISDAAG